MKFARLAVLLLPLASQVGAEETKRELVPGKPPSITPTEPPSQSPTGAPTCTGGMCGGDPHFQTWSGDYYDYHAECDLVFLQVPKFGKGPGMDIHIRTKARYQYSFIESAALRIGDDVLEVSSFGDYTWNGVSSAGMPAKMANLYPVTRQQVNKRQSSFDIHLGGDEHIVINTNKDLVSVKIQNATETSFGESAGLMGGYPNGKMLGRDGKTLLEDPNQFGQEWQVLALEPKLFETLRAPQHPQECTPPTEAKAQRRLGEALITEEAAQSACAHWADGHKELCVYDVMAMGDLEIAEAGTY